jgi:hypothetical protein
MRLIKVNAPLGKGVDVVQTAFSAGIKKVSIHQVESHQSDGAIKTKDVVDIETSTPKAKHFIDKLLAADFYNPNEFDISTRAALSIISQESLRELTKPLPEIVSDICEELFQFSYITYSFVGRVFISGGLLAYGMIQQNLLILIAGLLFLPLLPLLQAIGFGAWTRERKLFVQGASAFLLAIILLVISGILVAIISNPPIRFNEFSSLPVGFLISLAVGIAAGLAIIDDAGKREMIGLAATAQIALIPTWFGICLVFGFPVVTGENVIFSRALSFLINVFTIIIAATAVHILCGTANGSLTKLNNK